MNPNELIREYIIEHVDVQSINNDEDMFESGLVNSLFTIQLMTFLEKTFNIKISMDDLDMENFKSITKTSEFVLKKQRRIS